MSQPDLTLLTLEVILRLEKQPVIDVNDLTGIDRHCRCVVAAELWDLCTENARRYLLTDGHHFVRSCAVLSSINGPDPRGSFFHRDRA